MYNPDCTEAKFVAAFNDNDPGATRVMPITFSFDDDLVLGDSVLIMGQIFRKSYWSLFVLICHRWDFSLWRNVCRSVISPLENVNRSHLLYCNMSSTKYNLNISVTEWKMGLKRCLVHQKFGGAPPHLLIDQALIYIAAMPEMLQRINMEGVILLWPRMSTIKTNNPLFNDSAVDFFVMISI